MKIVFCFNGNNLCEFYHFIFLWERCACFVIRKVSFKIHVALLSFVKFLFVTQPVGRNLNFTEVRKLGNVIKKNFLINLLLKCEHRNFNLR